MKRSSVLVFAMVGGLAAVSLAVAQTKPEETEVWKPAVPVVAPTQDTGGAPADAIILFDGKNLDQWVSALDKSPAGWTVEGGVFTVDKARGNIETKQSFRDYQLHLEWRIPVNITGSGQARGNSGVFLASTGSRDQGYEVQILDSYGNATYVNGQAASVYKQHPPLANASRKPGEWQTYDIVWHAPVFGADGALTTPANVTVIHNGVVAQDHAVLAGETVYIGKPSYKTHGPAPIKLQAHGDPSEPISFRNIWVRELAPR
ncbi:3-keto-disaccharide hydrolase [Caulobacter segnis]